MRVALNPMAGSFLGLKSLLSSFKVIPQAFCALKRKLLFSSRYVFNARQREPNSTIQTRQLKGRLSVTGHVG